MEATVAARHIGEVHRCPLRRRVIRMVTLWSGGNPEPVTRSPSALIVGAAHERDTDGLPDRGVDMGRSYRRTGPALSSVPRGGRRSAARDGISQTDTPCAQCASVDSEPMANP
jgi:hypothetical protein